LTFYAFELMILHVPDDQGQSYQFPEMTAFKTLIVFLLLPLISAASVANENSAAKAAVGLEEKLGSFLPVDSVFHDERGNAINLRNRIDKPTIIAPVYFGCMHECPMLLTGLAQVLGRMELLKPGKDYQVIALSFDDHDTPAVAQKNKKNYLKAVGKAFPGEAWMFVTGKSNDIRKFTDSIGFSFQRDSEHDFSHPIALVVVAPGGKIVRYLEGVSFLPFEMTMALTEASEGKIGSPARKALMYCFSYDPLKKSYVFNILKVTGTVMILFVAGFLIYLLKSARSRRL
jgi:protein SCO1/2